MLWFRLGLLRMPRSSLFLVLGFGWSPDVSSVGHTFLVLVWLWIDAVWARLGELLFFILLPLRSWSTNWVSLCNRRLFSSRSTYFASSRLWSFIVNRWVAARPRLLNWVYLQFLLALAALECTWFLAFVCWDFLNASFLLILHFEF